MLCDIHNHLGKGMTAEEVSEYYLKLKTANGVDRNCILSIPVSPSAKVYHTQNLLSLQVKDMLTPYSSAFMGLVHGEGAEDYLTQLKNGLEMGFEGLKILECHPSLELELDFRMNDTRFDAMFQYAEDNGIPILMHVADPEESWDINTINEYALTHGRFYGAEGRRQKEEYYREIDDILQRHPKLKVIFAHFYFLSADIDRATVLFEKYPNVCFDLTPGKEMYENFGKDLGKTRAFFERFADRLYYGTDVNDTSAINYHSSLYTLVSTALESKEPFEWRDYTCAGLGLSDETKEKIMSGNFIKLLGETPKPLNYEAVRREITRLESISDSFGDKDIEQLAVAKQYFADK